MRPAIIIGYLSFILVLHGSLAWAQATQSAPYRMTREELPTSLSPYSAFRELVTREESGDRTLDRRVLEAPSVNGGYEVVLEVEEETIRLDSENNRFVRREFDSDQDGDRSVIRTIEEDRIERADGSSEVLRSFSERDGNGRLQPMRREIERRVQTGPGVYQTEVEVSVPGSGSGRFVPTRRSEQVERRDADDRILELEETTDWSPVASQGWVPLERRQVSYTYGDQETQSTEQIYRTDGLGNLSLSDRLVTRTWVESDGSQRRTEQTYERNIPGLPRFSEPRLYRQVDTVTETGPDGTTATIRDVQEFQVNRLRVVERVIERSRPDGRGGVVRETEVQSADANGRLRTRSVSTQTESGSIP